MVNFQLLRGRPFYPINFLILKLSNRSSTKPSLSSICRSVELLRNTAFERMILMKPKMCLRDHAVGKFPALEGSTILPYQFFNPQNPTENLQNHRSPRSVDLWKLRNTAFERMIPMKLKMWLRGYVAGKFA